MYEQCRHVAVGHSVIAVTPVLPAFPMGIAREEADGVVVEMLLQAALELQSHLRAEAVPHELGQGRGSCFNPFLQTDALVQRAGVLTISFPPFGLRPF